MKVWGAFFSLAEAFNRRATFMAAYRIARDKEMANPYEFAKRCGLRDAGSLQQRQPAELGARRRRGNNFHF
jgi:hypothetical protein